MRNEEELGVPIITAELELISGGEVVTALVGDVAVHGWDWVVTFEVSE
jgi:hypothetical protein